MFRERARLCRCRGLRRRGVVHILRRSLARIYRRVLIIVIPTTKILLGSRNELKWVARRLCRMFLVVVDLPLLVRTLRCPVVPRRWSRVGRLLLMISIGRPRTRHCRSWRRSPTRTCFIRGLLVFIWNPRTGKIGQCSPWF